MAKDITLLTVGELIDYINDHAFKAVTALAEAQKRARICLGSNNEDIDLDTVNEAAYDEASLEYIKEEELADEARKLLCVRLAG